MPRLTDRRRSERRAHVLLAARLCFQAQGFHATSMGDIVKASALSAGAVYGYFKSKEELILAAAEASMLELREEILPILGRDPPPPRDFLRQIQDSVNRISDRGPIDLRRMAVLGWAEAQRNEALRHQLRGHYGEFLKELIRIAEIWHGNGITAGSTPISTASLVMSAIFGFLAQAAIWDALPGTDQDADIGYIIR
ncbi:TetR/AcrR family transcriptional regulator [Rhodovarius crocodyli]|uniref:TetR/AcrR family transcriptional regulator n=1 Tax=Rhodovarius crocodyli TaxID=1979269 RepID=UPI0013E3BB5B|nr:TetR/AcrR family transcriptional regulator [Rhodovarius crocodyli]